jgi:hypothetical protein
MRKQNGKHTDPNGKYRQPNALKHGVFSTAAILPGEDRGEFQELLAGLFEEWKPSGQTEEDTVRSLAAAEWNGRRCQKFLHAKAEGCKFDPEHPLFDEGQAVAAFYFIVKGAPDEFDRALACLSGRHAEHLGKKFRQDNFESNSDWLQALKHEIYSVLLPTVEPFEKLPIEVLLDRSSRILSPDKFERHLAILERIEATKDRLIRRLMQLKAVKECLVPPPKST